MNPSLGTVVMLRHLLDGPYHGYGLMQKTGWPSGKVYAILERLTREGWITRRDSDYTGGHGRTLVIYEIAPAKRMEAMSVVAYVKSLLR